MKIYGIKMNTPKLKMKTVKKMTKPMTHIPTNILAGIGVAVTSILVLWGILRKRRGHRKQIMAT